MGRWRSFSEPVTHCAESPRDRDVLGQWLEVPQWLTVSSFGDRSGWGEDGPIWPRRLQRDGWNLVSEGVVAKSDLSGGVWIQFDPPLIWERPHPIAPASYVLRMTVSGIGERGGPWYLTEHAVLANGASEEIGRSEWADWSHSGDLLFAKDSSIYRAPYVKSVLTPVSNARLVADLESFSFRKVKTSPSAKRWPER